MRGWPFHSVRARLTLWYLLTLAGGLLTFALFVFVVRAHTLDHELDVDVEARARELDADLRGDLLALDVGRALAGDPRASEAPLAVRGAPGETLFRSPRFPATGWAAEAALQAAVRGGRDLVTIEDRTGERFRVVTYGFHRPGSAPLEIQVAGSTGQISRTLRQLAFTMLAGIAAVLLLAAYGSSLTVRRALAPVDQIVARVREIQASRLDDRLEIAGGSDELDRLVLTLNEMLDRIGGSMRSARRFAADASHELQSPLAAMRLAVEGCLRRNDFPPRYQGMAADLHADIERLSVLVRDLRLLALAESRELPGGAEIVDLAHVALECCEIARALGQDRGINVESRIEARPRVRGSALHLSRVVLNLAENAIRYSQEGSAVEVVVSDGAGRARVTVRDHGCGISPHDLPHIFEPFYRADPARARETGGTGLGLAIADQVARAHGGRIGVASRPGEGATFTVELPSLAPADAPAPAPGPDPHRPGASPD